MRRDAGKRKTRRFAVRDHFALYWSSYLGAMAVGLLLIGMFFLSEHLSRRREAILQWPTTEGEIVESTVKRFSVSDEHGPNAQISADLLIRYSYRDRSYTNHVVRTWGLMEPNNYEQALAKGAKVTVRVSPEDSERVSLFPLITEL